MYMQVSDYSTRYVKSPLSKKRAAVWNRRGVNGNCYDILGFVSFK